MGLLDIFNKVFPEPKPNSKRIKRMQKKGENWQPDPKWFENKLKKRRNLRWESNSNKTIKKLVKMKYEVLPEERNPDGTINLDSKKKREEILDSRIMAEKDNLEKSLESAIDDYDFNVRYSDATLEDEKRQRKLKQKSSRIKNLDTSNNKILQGENYDEEYSYLYTKKEKFKTAIERLIELKYLSRDPQKREKQWQTLRVWIKYLKETYRDKYSFWALVMGVVLKYDVYWLDRNQRGNDWYSFERRNNKTNLDFPRFSSDTTPEILGTLKEVLELINDDNERVIKIRRTELNERYGNEFVKKLLDAVTDGDIRLFFSLISERIKLSKIDYDQVIEKLDEKWLPTFTFKNPNGSEKTEVEKQKVAHELAGAVSFSRGFCIKSPATAYEYLTRGDLYVYNVNYEVDLNKGKKDKDEKEMEPDITEVVVPEIAIHTLRTVSLDTKKETGKVVINPKEIHGNAPNQGINKEYLEVARKWVSESSFSNKDEFEIKFADAEMLATVEEKINNLKNGGEDLNARELKFLYQIYRPVTSFELQDSILTKVRELMLKRTFMLCRENAGQKDFDEIKKDDAKMFDIPVERFAQLPFFESTGVVTYIKNGDFFVKARELKPIRNETIPSSVKVLFGSLNLIFSNADSLYDMEEITGNLYLSANNTAGNLKTKLKSLGMLKAIHGITLTEEDKKRILSGEIDQFPESNDPRLKKILY